MDKNDFRAQLFNKEATKAPVRPPEPEPDVKVEETKETLYPLHRIVSFDLLRQKMLQHNQRAEDDGKLFWLFDRLKREEVNLDKNIGEYLTIREFLHFFCDFMNEPEIGEVNGYRSWNAERLSAFTKKRYAFWREHHEVMKLLCYEINLPKTFPITDTITGRQTTRIEENNWSLALNVDFVEKFFHIIKYGVQPPITYDPSSNFDWSLDLKDQVIQNGIKGYIHKLRKKAMATRLGNF